MRPAGEPFKRKWKRHSGMALAVPSMASRKHGSPGTAGWSGSVATIISLEEGGEDEGHFGDSGSVDLCGSDSERVRERPFVRKAPEHCIPVLWSRGFAVLRGFPDGHARRVSDIQPGTVCFRTPLSPSFLPRVFSILFQSFHPDVLSRAFIRFMERLPISGGERTLLPECHGDRSFAVFLFLYHV